MTSTLIVRACESRSDDVNVAATGMGAAAMKAQFSWCTFGGWRKAAMAAAMVTLAGCGNGDRLRETLGVVQKGPDPFATLPRKPLEMPKGTSLPVPTPGAPSRVAVDTLKEAHMLLGAGRVEQTAPSAAEASLLIATGATKATAPRQQIDAEAAANKPTSYLLDEWLGRTRPPPDALDARTEAERLGLKPPPKPK